MGYHACGSEGGLGKTAPVGQQGLELESQGFEPRLGFTACSSPETLLEGAVPSLPLGSQGVGLWVSSVDWLTL